MATARQLIARARDTDNLGTTIVGGIGGTFLAVFYSGIDLIQAIVNLLVLPLEALGTNAAANVTALVGGAARIVQQGALTTQQSILPGQAWAVGPLTFGFSIAATGAGLFIMSEILARAPTSDLIPFTFTDVPFVGVDEEEEGSE
ncbi:hypothetical protein [Haloarcula halophila]|uniref:hypothetical protein n=1 Tax=Haloarcula TaxID=2237 RepID=UPI0023E38D7F|nr:hypothetical protein [Halomicroarcula sp. DFY41]